MDMKPWLLDQYQDVGTLLIQKESRDCPPQVKLALLTFKTWAQMSEDLSYHTRMEDHYSKDLFLSIPKDMGTFNCGAYVAGTVRIVRQSAIPFNEHFKVPKVTFNIYRNTKQIPLTQTQFICSSSPSLVGRVHDGWNLEAGWGGRWWSFNQSRTRAVPISPSPSAVMDSSKRLASSLFSATLMSLSLSSLIMATSMSSAT
ncbi:hypothetical protein TorRG33x02_119420 [Trema orientale]|uniref:Uncharacterized protein n=1 Tax=Trema orientale TaxID=63057 RepID=A0A2P5F3D6_TREOI|nr:hypothetical protein TorRG33x02_119420 [Trema orientale]